MSKLLGDWAENLALEHLQSNGLKLVQRNYRCRGGELDLIMQDGKVLAFVEVRYRRSQRFGGAVASVDQRKQQRIALAASHYLQRHANQSVCRFDVVSVGGTVEKPSIEWLKDAFRLGF